MEQLNSVLAAGLGELQQTVSLHELEQLKSRYIGKQGQITLFMQKLKEIAPEERKAYGAQVNQIKTQFEALLTARRDELSAAELAAKLASESIDVSLPGRGIARGSLHPITLGFNRLIAIFAQLGFAVADGPEIETDYYNFKALNIPDNHPARAMQDTFYTESANVLRTHTSPLQVRYAENRNPPIKVIAPGRVYRVDMDATHSPMFHQMELLWIDKGISFANFKAVISEFMRKFFEDDSLKVRFRASFFPFTEPSAEVDIYFAKTGKWLEVGGCGMVHPRVLNYMNISAEEYSGFAFGFGVDRLTMLKYGITDLRLMFDNDLDFLTQFKG
ncbi:MAG: phenylalanine--tRNA ligase subunit alpha [Burkholderiales bacterium]|jgi:phenylalanyl-tRNA synthetase alpha chain|nr:phenylalanine--tRNA ligase subunit alpha [Burkholderiales bacterium]